MKANKFTLSRRFFLKVGAVTSALAPVIAPMKSLYIQVKERLFTPKETLQIETVINDQTHQLKIDSRSTLLDLLREQLNLTGTKKGCDHGQCGACTVHIDGQRALSCLTLAATVQGKSITTIEGLANGDQLHPMQEAFLECDGFQCGYCTPGQIMSAVACVQEGHTGSKEEIKVWMSGNICRCGAYNGITEAVEKVAQS